MCKDTQEILFQKAILALIVEVCQKPEYKLDIEMFLKFLTLLKMIAKNNKLFYESQEHKERYYSFVLSQFDNFLASVIDIYICQ